MFDKAIAIQESLVRHEGRVDLWPDLVQFMLNREIPLRELGRWSDARAALQQVIPLLERPIREPGRDMRNALAMAYSELAFLAVQEDDLRAARKYYGECIAIWRRLMQEGKREFARYLELAERNLANTQ